MTAFEISARAGGLALILDEITLEVAGVIRYRANIRANVSVRSSDRLLFRDNVNLSGQRARLRFIRQVATHGATVTEEALLALDEAARLTPKLQPNGQK